MPRKLFDSIVGIDEVARCPVLGSMVIAGVGVKEGFDFSIFEKLGVKDSKLLSKTKIIEIAQKLFLVDDVLIKHRKMSGKIISESDNINNLEAEYAAKIIKAFRTQTKVKEIYIDNCDKCSEQYKERLKRFLKLNEAETKYVIENKADENYLVVSAASIIAKYISDKEYNMLRQKHDIGSGSPNDKKTIEFIKVCINKGKTPEFLRTNWITYKRLKKELELGGKQHVESI